MRGRAAGRVRLLRARLWGRFGRRRGFKHIGEGVRLFGEQGASLGGVFLVENAAAVFGKRAVERKEKGGRVGAFRGEGGGHVDEVGLAFLTADGDEFCERIARFLIAGRGFFALGADFPSDFLRDERLCRLFRLRPGVEGGKGVFDFAERRGDFEQFLSDLGAVLSILERVRRFSPYFRKVCAPRASQDSGSTANRKQGMSGTSMVR